MTPRAKRRGLTAMAVIANILSVCAVFIILSVWFLVPNDPSQTQAHNAVAKLKVVAAFAVALVALVSFSRWAVKMRGQ